MDWELVVNSLIQLIHYTAWPLTILVLILIFRKAIFRSLGLLKKMSVGDKLTLEFLPLELQKKIAEKVKFEEVTKDSYTWDNYLDALEILLAWVAICAGDITILRILGHSIEGDERTLKIAVRDYNKVAKKIEKERPESEALKIMSDLMNKAISELKSYESSRPKPHWSDDL